MHSTKPVRLIAFITLLLASVLGFCVAQNEDPGDTLIALLNQSIEWYRRVQIPAQLSIDPSDSIYTSYNRSSSLQAISLIFEFARTQAQEIQLAHPQNAAPQADNSQASHSLTQWVAKGQDRVKQATSDLDALQRQAANATGKKRQTLEEQIAEQKSELELAQARLEAVQNMNAFATAGASAGLLGKINELERNVPEARIERHVEHNVRSSQMNRAEGASNGSANSASGNSSETSSGVADGIKGGTASDGGSGNTSSSSAAAAMMPFSPVMVTAQQAPSTPPKQAETGIVSLTSDLFSLIRKLKAQREAANATAQLRLTLDRVRAPLRQQLRAVNQRGEELSAQPQSSDPAVLADRKKQIEALTAEFKHLSTIVLPLAKTSILLDATSNNLAEWRAETQRTYSTAARSLLYRVGVLLLAIIVVGIASELWRRAIFRYIREQRRRNQFLLLRRIVVTLVITLIVILGLSTEIGSLATFAGFLTAGIAVALQNVILSVAAYFFLIGRYGIRVGDRVQIGAVTGDVVDIGLVRLHLVELDTSAGEARPTGRIVVFSNSVVFQPTSNFFKQLPGSNFAWRRISLTLATDVDYAIAQKRISTAVAGVYDTYKAELERQHRVLESSLAIHISSTEPQTRLRLEETGLEIVILYPVVLSQASQIDDRMTHALLEAIEGDPRLRLVGGGLTNIKPVDATPNAAPVPVQK
ncbi:MAG TPA: mechanosensitive ion channel domain-containing protein [Candidatus Saccharimonadales bacterium]|nr:mechanosensitive ion channel domain-containing protein [Candidatus Saccharimonadales bacterium]